KICPLRLLRAGKIKIIVFMRNIINLGWSRKFEVLRLRETSACLNKAPEFFNCEWLIFSLFILIFQLLIL
ncbi:MAG: hypothetical protein Q8N88_00595, partial [Nanoarchaeota archaeon]|nr:hypothetical protein [Nanoarchaeota archaeon]